MEYKRGILPIVGLIVLFNCARFASAQTLPPPTQPVATLDLSESLPEESGELISVVFSSDNSVVMWLYRTTTQGPQYSQYYVQWGSGSFKRIAQTEGPRWGGRSSSDGGRMLFNFGERKVPRFQQLLETFHTITTLGMSAPEDVNGEVVRVIDTATRKSCFDWRRRFPMDWRRGRFATISPSGELVAITVKNTLSIYRLPPVCEGPTKVRDK
jgi:hypothetical protein